MNEIEALLHRLQAADEAAEVVAANGPALEKPIDLIRVQISELIDAVEALAAAR